MLHNYTVSHKISATLLLARTSNGHNTCSKHLTVTFRWGTIQSENRRWVNAMPPCSPLLSPRKKQVSIRCQRHTSRCHVNPYQTVVGGWPNLRKIKDNHEWQNTISAENESGRKHQNCYFGRSRVVIMALPTPHAKRHLDWSGRFATIHPRDRLWVKYGMRKIEWGTTAIGQQLWPYDHRYSAVYHTPRVDTAVVKCVTTMENTCLCAMLVDLMIIYSLYNNLDCCQLMK